ncbi:MAG: TorF family putative porin [Opitutus sp.]
MNKRFLHALLCASLASPVAVSAQTAAPAATSSGPSITATATAVSQYMFRGQRLGGLSFQPAVEAGLGDGVLGLWSNFPIKDEVPDTSDPELDVYGSYRFAVGDAISISPGFTWYVYPDAPTDLGFYRSTFEPNLALSYAVLGLQLTPKIYYDFTLEGPTYELTAAYALPLAAWGTELNFTATVGSFLIKDASKGSDPSTKAWGDYWLVGVSVPVQVSSSGKLVIGLAFTEGKNAFFKQGSAGKSPNSLAVGRAVVTLSYSHSF